jgi:hypothetical protein
MSRIRFEDSVWLWPHDHSDRLEFTNISSQIFDICKILGQFVGYYQALLFWPLLWRWNMNMGICTRVYIRTLRLLVRTIFDSRCIRRLCVSYMIWYLGLYSVIYHQHRSETDVYIHTQFILDFLDIPNETLLKESWKILAMKHLRISNYPE